METGEKMTALIEQYKIYIESKDKFVERSFQTNRFFLIFVTLLFLILCLIETSIIYDMTSPLLFSGIGMGACFLWWANAEMYDFLIDVKFNRVICKIEEHLPLQIHAMEKAGFDEKKKSKIKLHLSKLTFPEVQKLISVGSFFVFFIVAVREVIF